MKKLDLYLIKKFLGPFLVVFLIVVFTLSLQFIWQYITELAGKGLSLGVIFEFLGWAACTLLPNEIPLATLLASIMTLGGLGERNELLAMKAAGISLMRIMAPLIIISVMITVGAFFVADRLVPYAFNKVYTLKQDIMRTRDQIKIPTGIFYNGIDGYILRVSDRNEETDMMYDLIIYDHTGNTGNTSMTVADSGRIEITPDKENLIFNLYHGCSYTESNTMNYRDTSLELSRLRFDEQQLIIQLDNYSFQRSEKDNFGDELKSLGLKRLKEDRDSIARQVDSLVRKQMPRFASTMAMNYLYQLDTLLNKDKVYTGTFDLDSALAEMTPLQQMQARRAAAGKAETGEEQIRNFERETAMNVNQLRRYDVEAIVKFTLALSCLIFFFIGAPLGAIIRKGGLGIPVIISVLVFIIFYLRPRPSS